MQAHEVSHSLQGPLQIDGATKKHYQDQETYVGKVHKGNQLCDNDDGYLSHGHCKQKTNGQCIKG